LRNLIFIFVLLFPASLKAQPADSLVLHSVSDEISDEAQIESKFEPDTLAVQQKSFDLTEIDKLKADSDLNYKQPPTVVETLWDRFKRWLSWLLNSLFETAATTDMGNLIIYIIAAIIVIAAIMALLKVNAFKVFYSGADQAKQNYSVFHENIHEMDFDKLINEAVRK
jgi:archaellum component FlaG (FlaF/FlaG flagellin family)